MSLATRRKPFRRGLKAEWMFRGDAKDSSPNAINGTVTGASLTADHNNRNNNAYTFNGDNQNINMGNPVALRTLFPLTVVYSFYYENAGANRTIFNKGTQNSAGSVYIWFYQGNTEVLRQQLYQQYKTGDLIGNGTAYAVGSQYYGQWIHVTFTAESNAYKTYINGNLANTLNHATAVTEVIKATEDFIIGGYTASLSYDWTGEIDNISLSGQILTTSEIKQLYNYWRSH